jgi:hypothetical protein
MILTTQLNAICDLLRTDANMSAVTGRPNEKVRAIYTGLRSGCLVRGCQASTPAPCGVRHSFVSGATLIEIRG